MIPNNKSNFFYNFRQICKECKQIHTRSNMIVTESLHSVTVSTLSVTKRFQSVSVSLHSVTDLLYLVTELEDTVTISSHSVTKCFQSVTNTTDTVTIIEETVTSGLEYIQIWSLPLFISSISMFISI